MRLSPIIERFETTSPATVMAQAILEKVFAPEKLNDIFERHATLQYTRTLLFSTIVELMSLVVLRLRRSMNSAYAPLKESVGVSLKAVYDKLNHTEPPVSAALVRETAAEMGAAIHQMKGSLPPLLPGFRVRFLDGNCLTRTEHRLLELRDVKAAPLPGKSLAILDQETGLISDLVPCEDAYAQERSLLDQILAKAQADDLWVADRNFCTCGFLTGLSRAKARFVIREHANLPWAPVGRLHRRESQTPGSGLLDQEIVTRDPEGNPLLLRRIIVRRSAPTRDGDHEVVLLTNLKEHEASAAKVSEIYAARWSVETAFQKLTDILRCEVSTLGYPKAALFAFAVAVTSYNVVATIEAALRAHHGAEKIREELSTYHLTAEISLMFGAQLRMVPDQDWARIRALGVQEFADYLLRLARCIDLNSMRKARRGPKKPVTAKTRYKGRPHISTQRLLEERNDDRLTR